MLGHFTPPEANFYYTMVCILPAEILFSVLTYVGIGTLNSYLQLLMFQPPQLRQHSHLPTRPTPNSNGNINTIAHSILCLHPINLSSIRRSVFASFFVVVNERDNNVYGIDCPIDRRINLRGYIPINDDF